ncbi:hypothetical protein K437DRAFT_103604 [Tilletiaria anomala UBC 951]|uniref:Uncharacterized protein n=1 Tax=Tilletiaria anomala (strain ATCC 24038 / CBS 436.72 / UBC 951) TaxID=1037660 RepID=A0A066W8A9_TILAU|nr:uncharacterized protein K437DRAFT_103604 [Tilletiaria anomala UBC 951]KDN47010.1 hypothetical protein K437DRAFT_103604 [Tilletiaria anomala UBC 951]
MGFFSTSCDISSPIAASPSLSFQIGSPPSTLTSSTTPYNILKVTSKLSSSYPVAIDGQIERVIETLNAYLRCYVEYLLNDRAS